MYVCIYKKIMCTHYVKVYHGCQPLNCDGCLQLTTLAKVKLKFQVKKKTELSSKLKSFLFL